MERQYRTVYAGGTAQITEKKSRFIANVFPVSSEEEVPGILSEIRKKYWDARHSCWAYVIGSGQSAVRYSDDGEPSQTAGKPILDVIMGQDLRDVLVVVTRYFGGILLGTGGLVRAYSKAAQEGLAHSKIIARIFGIKLKIRTDYTDFGKIQYILGQRGLKTEEIRYTEAVEILLPVPEEEKKRVEEEIIEAANGRAVLEEEGPCWFADVDGQLIIF